MQSLCATTSSYDYILMIAHQNAAWNYADKYEGYDYILMIAHQNLMNIENI